MSRRRTWFITVIFALSVDPNRGYDIVDPFLDPKPMEANDNEVDNKHSREIKQDSGKTSHGEGALEAIVAELRTEVRALKSELRGVQLGLSECAAARADARRVENDHVRVQWMQREMAETRKGRKDVC